MKELITIDQYFTDFITKKNRRIEYPADFTQEIQDNAVKLLEKVNAFLAEIGVMNSRQVTSGWRPDAINSATPNAAKKSLHMRGLAVDILDDKDQTLAKLVLTKPDVLRKYGLFVESPDHTKGKNTNWCHLDCSPERSDRPSRMFIP